MAAIAIVVSLFIIYIRHEVLGSLDILYLGHRRLN